MDSQTLASDPSPARTDQAQAATRRALGLIFSIMLMDIVGLGILSPVAPYIVRRYSNEA